jgi:hypothetical protein
MIKDFLFKIKNFFRAHETNKQLTRELISEYIKNHELKRKVADPKEVLNSVFQRGIEWYDWNTLPTDELRRAYKDAQHFLNSDIVLNMKNQFIAAGAQRALLEETHDTNRIRDFQMAVTGIELLFEMLGEIVDPDNQSKKPKT